jgi:P4 family phage/plasmid primase-like protien
VLEDRDEVDVMAVSDGSFRAFQQGVWKHEGGAGEQRLRDLGSKALQSRYSSNVLEQLKEATRHRNQYHVEELGIDEPWAVVGDQALNLDTRETRPVDRDDLALRRIEAEYDPDAEPDLWLDFLSRVAATPETIQKLQEYFGYCLWFHGQPFGKGLFLVGDTDSGKGTALKTLGAILGREENVANESLRDLLESRWGKAQLYGRIVNIRNEVTPGGLANIEDFKELLGGGDRVTAERKGEQKFRFTVTQKFVFATNQFPDVENADNAFWNRCLFARFPETIPDEEQRPEFHDELLAERSGILNWMLDGLDRLFDQGGFTGERPIDEKRNIAEEVGSPLERLKQDALEITREPTDLVHARDLYDLATAYAEDVGMDEGVPAWQGGAFTSALRAWPGVAKGRSRQFDGGGQDRVFKGLRVDMEVAERLNVDVRARDETPNGQTGLDV